MVLLTEQWLKVMDCLLNIKPIPAKYEDHPLHGYKNGLRDCHIKPDLVLIYRIVGNTVELHQLNTHSELFG